ncbi:radical SAM protein [Natranaerofaba carboxydovora]|uniref:radical SAM protein n=1 Tax=Natranaerofaba carboxydovora TaxID=2742683 RepID=UPI001F13D35C|nr:radical SAM protein [Natranaerofaba carboxydovora]UMZ74849.1 Radical SAM superfamily protein [Natranaerofaba carboxydovora]
MDNLNLILESIHNSNILPLISGCNLNCIFCSNNQNPPDLKEIRLPPLTLNEVKEASIFLDEKKKIIIGESATKISEGEPFLHPNIIEILEFLRDKYPLVPIQITTNGTLIDDNILKVLKNLEPIEINLSINVLDEDLRCEIMKDTSPYIARELPQKFNRLGIDYNGSIVSLSFLYGWERLLETIKHLEDNGAKTVRLFVPGFTKFNDKLKVPPDYYQELYKIKDQFDVPILIEPSIKTEAAPIVSGVIKDSPAHKKGIKRNDLILKIDEEDVPSSVHAYRLVTYKKNPVISLENKTVKIEKSKGESSGLCFDYDISPEEIKFLAGLSVSDPKTDQKKNILLLASEGGYNILKRETNKAKDKDKLQNKVDIKKVKSKYLGGNIISAGLLVVDDFRDCLKKQFFAEYLKENYDCVILPGKAFDNKGFDLRGEHYSSLEDEFDIEVELFD